MKQAILGAWLFFAMLTLTATEWVNENPSFVPGKHGEALAFGNASSRLFLKTPGLLDPRQGTLQFWIALQKDAVELESWGTQISTPSSRRDTGFSTFHASVITPANLGNQATSAKLIVGFRNDQLKRMETDIDWKKGEWHAVAYTWGPAGEALYMDGRRMDYRETPASFPYTPDYLAFGGGVTSRHGIVGESMLDDIELSDHVRTPEYIKLYAAGKPPVPDEHTLAYFSCDKAAADYAKPTARLLDQGTPEIVPDSGIFTDNRIFAAGSTAQFGFYLLNFGKEAATFELSAAVFDAYGKARGVDEKKFTLSAQARDYQSLPLKSLEPGWYTAKVTGKRNGTEMFNGEWSFVILPKPAPAAADSRFAGHLSQMRNRDFFARAGILWEREMTAFTWKCVEPQAGQWDWSQADYIAKEARQNKLQMVAILGHPARWAAGKLGSGQNNSVPLDLEAYRNYVYQTVSRYKDVIHYWEIINEPDWIFGEPGDLGKDREFAAPGAKYLELLKVGYETIKAADPQAVVVSGGFVPHLHLIKYLAQNGGGKYFDILGMHRYRPWSHLEEYAKYFPGKEVWQTEHLVATPEEVAEDVFQTYNLGVKRNFFFDTPLMMTYFTLDTFSAHGWSPQKPYFAIAQAAAKLEGKTLSGKITFDRLNNQLFGLLFDRGQASQEAMIYSLYAGNAPLRLAVAAANNGKLTVTDLMGQTQTFAVKKGEKTVFAIKTLTFVEGPFDPASFTVERDETREYLINSDFKILNGDIGMDQAKGMMPANWHCEKELGDITIEMTEPRAAKLVNSGKKEKENVRILQKIICDTPGYYEITGEFKRVAGDPAADPMAYLSLTETENPKNTFWAGYDKVPTDEWITRKHGLRVEKADTQLLVLVGVVRPGTVLVRNLSVMRVPDPDKVKSTVLIDLGPAANLNADFSNFATGSTRGLNGSSFAAMPVKLQELKGALYQLRDQAPQLLAVGSAPELGMPLNSDIIAVNAKCKELRILSTALYVSAAPNELLGRCLVTYDDGTTAEVPLRRGVETDDWYAMNEVPWAAAKIATPDTRYLYQAVWQNPEPGKTVKSLQLTGTNKGIVLIIAISGSKP